MTDYEWSLSTRPPKTEIASTASLALIVTSILTLTLHSHGTVCPNASYVAEPGHRRMSRILRATFRRIDLINIAWSSPQRGCARPAFRTSWAQA
jgi:hypothetical protein